jgi:hypothetical protein
MTQPSSDEVLSILIHAPSKHGKSSLAFTAPMPMVIFDAEGSTKFIRTAGWQGPTIRKISWDPMRDAPPRYDGTWDVAIVKVTNWETLITAYQHLQHSPHDFISVVVDSITEAQRRLKKNLRGTEQMQMQDWGNLLMKMDDLIRGLRDLTLLDNTVRCVVFVAETREKNGKYRPYMQGQIEVSLPYWVDVCGYLQLRQVLDDPNGQPTGKQTELTVVPNDLYEAGERVQGRLPDVIASPRIDDIISVIYG